MRSDITCETGSVVFDFHANDHIDPPFSHFWVWGLVGTLVYCILRSVLHRTQSLRLAREADAAVNSDAPLAQGTRFLCGRVEYAEGQSNAIAVHVEQHGTETKGKNSWSHRWTEMSRATHAQPFYVRRPNGERVRVEPGDEPLLVDKPDQKVWKQRDRRTRIATLTPGEEVIVQGVLGKGHDPELRDPSAYRNTGQGWVMTSARGERMEVSAEKLGERHRKRASAFGWAIFYLIGTLTVVNLLFMYYHVRLFMGEDTCAEVTSKNISYTRDSKGRRTSHYNVNVRVEAPGTPNIVRELDDSDWEQVQVGTVLGFRYIPGKLSLSDLGAGTSTHIMTIIFGVLTGLVGWGIYTGNRDYRRWYEGKLEDSGSGKLPDPPPGP
jgi:hypothetical protein